MPPAVIQNITQEKNDCQVNLNFITIYFMIFWECFLSICRDIDYQIFSVIIFFGGAEYFLTWFECDIIFWLIRVKPYF